VIEHVISWLIMIGFFYLLVSTGKKAIAFKRWLKRNKTDA
jgi:NDP-sugar pyrophosphorylase family protein